MGGAAVGSADSSDPADPATTVAAPTFVVNSLFDVPASYADPAHTLCRTATNNTVCTLRAAIMKANAYGGGASIILPSGMYALTQAPAGDKGELNGDLTISDTVTISGAGPATTIIDAGGLDRVFQIEPGTTAVIR